jgi:hypothetical protein
VADVEALRAKIVELGAADAIRRGGRFNVNDLHARLTSHFQGEPPISRATMYAWFGNDGAPPKQSLLECVPAFAVILGVPEYELWQVAGILPPPMDASLAIASTVHDLRAAHRRMQKTLANNGLSTAGEALVIDRIMHAKLDYRMHVWPVVRGRVKPLHLHSWIALEPLPESESTRRHPTQILQELPPWERRHYLRHTVISDGLWRALGLNWRTNTPDEFAAFGPDPLFLEVPVEERNRKPPPEPLYPALAVDHIVVLGGPWAHAELMASLLADALQFGSWDLRYLGFTQGPDKEPIVRFCRDRLVERRERFVWAIAQRADVMRQVREALHAVAAPRVLVVAMTFAPRLADFAASALNTKSEPMAAAIEEVRAMAATLDGRCDTVHIEIDADEVLGPSGAPRPDSAVRDAMVDHVRWLTAAVLDKLYWHRGGPGLTRWGDRFEDLRLGDEESVPLPLGGSTVRWSPGQDR